MEHISEILTGGGDLVTFRLLSRKAGVTVNTAKELLEEYAQGHRDKVHACYLVMGDIKGSSADSDALETEIRVVPQESLEETKALYTNCSVHIFSIANAPVKNTYEVLANVESEVNKSDSVDLMMKCRVLKNPQITYIDRPLFGKAPVPAPRIQPQPSTTAAPPKPTLQKQSSTSSTSSKSAAKSNDAKKKPNTTASKTSFFATQIKQDEERKQKAAVVDAVKQAEREKLKEKARAEAVKDAFVHKEVDEKLMGMFDEEDEVNVFRFDVRFLLSVSQKVNTKKRGAVDDDDEDGESDQDDHETKRLKLMAKLSAGPETHDDDDEEEVEAAAKPMEEVDEAMAVEDVVSPIEQQSEVQHTTRRIRRRRKVIKKVTQQVGKYMETKDVEGWESYSEDEVVPIVKSVPKIPVIQKPVDPVPIAVEEKKGGPSNNENKKASPAKPKGKAPATKKAAANTGQKLISSFFKK
ncbi:hypothetical protein HDU79_004528 [Rhizoclosmatium sp. JEL0117]|nr:hypothetical protein HDU79_004528 [Rhizoclosmatium sp. JEL0117]